VTRPGVMPIRRTGHPAHSVRSRHLCGSEQSFEVHLDR
jgi:hypothetical protein